MSSAYTERGYFWLSRLHSLSGVLLTIIFILCYLIPYSAAFDGPDSFDLFMGILHSLPLRGWFVFLFVAVPLVFHTLMGFYILYGASAKVISYPFYHNWMYVLQRFVGLLAIPVVIYHLYMTQLKFSFTSSYPTYAYMQGLFSPIWAKIFYGIGLGCIAVYIGNGAATCLARWGITVSKRSRDVATIAMWCVAFILVVWGIGIIFAFD